MQQQVQEGITPYGYTFNGAYSFGDSKRTDWVTNKDATGTQCARNHFEQRESTAKTLIKQDTTLPKDEKLKVRVQEGAAVGQYDIATDLGKLDPKGQLDKTKNWPKAEPIKEKENPIGYHYLSLVHAHINPISQERLTRSSHSGIKRKQIGVKMGQLQTYIKIWRILEHHLVGDLREKKISDILSEIAEPQMIDRSHKEFEDMELSILMGLNKISLQNKFRQDTHQKIQQSISTFIDFMFIFVYVFQYCLIIKNIEILQQMDQALQLQCMIVDHNELVLGICVQESCKAPTRIVCPKCLQTVHIDCKNQFYLKQDFLKRLNELKQVQELIEISHFKETSIQLSKSIKTLECLINDFIAQHDKSKQVNQLDQILKKQYLSANDWQNGYQLLTNRPVEISKDVQQLTAELHHIQQTIDKMIQNHTKKDISLINLQFNAQNTIKSDWNNITTQMPLIIKVNHCICTIALSPDGKYVASAGGGDYSIQIWNPITGKQVGNGMEGHTNSIRSINYSKCGKYIVSGSNDKTIRRWNVQTQQQIDQPLNGHESYVKGVQYTPDQRYIVSCSLDKTIRFWISQTGQELVDKRIQHEYRISCMSLSPISNDIAFGDDKGMITIYDYERHQLRGESLKGHTGYICQLQYSADGKYIVSSDNDKAILVWNAISRQQMASLIGHKQTRLSNYVFSVSFSPDMRYIISGGGDHTVRIWDRVEGKQIGETLTHHEEWVRSTQFSLDGQYIITGGKDQQLRIMVAPTNEKIEQIAPTTKTIEQCSLF